MEFLFIVGVCVAGVILYLKALKPWMLKQKKTDSTSDTDYSAGQ